MTNDRANLSKIVENSNVTDSTEKLQAYKRVMSTLSEAKLLGVTVGEIAEEMNTNKNYVYHLIAPARFTMIKTEKYKSFEKTLHQIIKNKKKIKESRKSNASEIGVTIEMEQLVSSTVQNNKVAEYKLDTVISRRDYFAAVVLAGLYSSNFPRTGNEPQAAVKIADKLIEELKK